MECVWIVDYGDHSCNWVATLYKDDTDAPWKLTYRFRYHRDGKVWHSKDKKSVYEMIAKDGQPETITELVKVCDRLQRTLTVATHGQAWKLPIRGGLDAFTKAVKQVPIFHSKEGPAADQYIFERDMKKAAKNN